MKPFLQRRVAVLALTLPLFLCRLCCRWRGVPTNHGSLLLEDLNAPQSTPVIEAIAATLPPIGSAQVS
ncbi:MAG: hypothetical protein ACUVSY_17635, partial [Roseiflexus sp.]